MNIIEYIADLYKIDFEIDEAGTRYFKAPRYVKSNEEYKNFYDIVGYDVYLRFCELLYDDDIYIITQDDYDKYASINLCVNYDINNFPFWVRRPYYKMRGMQVTPEQAFDIIKRTDLGLLLEVSYDVWHESCVSTGSFLNDIINRDMGWVFPSGRIGANGIAVVKNTTYIELLADVTIIAANFPYLNFFVAMTSSDENNWKKGDSYYSQPILERYLCPIYEPEEKFYSEIEYGFWYHDYKLEAVDKEKAVELYKRYEILAGYPNEVFENNYYSMRNMKACGVAYKKALFRHYGIDYKADISEENCLCETDLLQIDFEN